LKMGFFRAAAAAAALLAPAGVFAGTNSAGKKFLEENAGKEGVITLPSGMQYKVLKKGDGKHHPTVNSPCECHYEGTLIDGTKFDSSYDRGEPTTFAPNQVIKGWTEAMQLMVEGDKWEMYIPSELGYGDSGSPPKIKGGDVLVFKMEIIKIKGDKVDAVTCDPVGKDEKSGEKTYADCSKKEKEYVVKMEKSDKKLSEEVDRLKKMQVENTKSKNMTKKQRLWLDSRVKILAKMIEAEGKGKEEL